MSDDNLGVPARAALLALMASGGTASNPDLKARWKVDLTGKPRLAAEKMGLISSAKGARGALTHTLLGPGWAWCAKELSGAVPDRAGSAAGALYAVLAGIGRYLARTGSSLQDIFGAGSTPAPAPATDDDLPARIREAYRGLARGPQAWVSLADLRPKLAEFARTEVDDALKQLNRAQQINLVPESNQKSLTPAQQEAAISIGGEANHLISIELA